MSFVESQEGVQLEVLSFGELKNVERHREKLSTASHSVARHLSPKQRRSSGAEAPAQPPNINFATAST